jgi:hypothetical protein
MGMFRLRRIGRGEEHPIPPAQDATSEGGTIPSNHNGGKGGFFQGILENAGARLALSIQGMIPLSYEFEPWTYSSDLGA